MWNEAGCFGACKKIWSAKLQLIEYGHKSYTGTVYQPKKDEITASAMYFLKEFIKQVTENFKMEDWLLTKRENQVIALMSKGLDNNEIAESLDLSSATVSTYIGNIYQKYDVSGKNARLNAVLKYWKRGE